MTDRLKSVVIASLERVRPQAATPRLPLHVAVTPQFGIEYGKTDEVSETLRNHITNYKEFSIGFLEQVQSLNGTRIQKVGGSALYSIHDKLIPVIKRIDRTVVHDPDFEPTIEYPVSLQFDTTHVKHIGALTLAQQLHNRWYIVDNYPLNRYNNDWQAGIREQREV